MQVEHRQGERRFVAQTDAGEAELSYEQPREGVLDLLHTFVPVEARGEGVGEALVETALDHARGNGLQIIPSCPFVLRWVEAHPEQADLVATA